MEALLWAVLAMWIMILVTVIVILAHVFIVEARK